MAQAPLQNAGVRFPPPFIYLLGLLAAFLLNRAVPLWLANPEPRWMFRLGWAGTFAGILFSVWGVSTFRRHRTAITPFKPATTIVTVGPYRITRNPMYVGLIGVYVGASLLLDTWWAFALLPVVVLIIDRAVIRREERYLASAFAADYEAYRTRVRRWI
jgi:protein-S-isoprenylcysteine O-methyltransferase Ste14